MTNKQQTSGLIQRYCSHEANLLEKSHDAGPEDFNWQDTHLAEVVDQQRKNMGHFPNISEIEVVRHFTRLSMRNFSLEEGMYPLGSCTMKYNPKINEVVAALVGFRDLHPQQPVEQCQGALEVLYHLQNALCAITGLDTITLQPAAGAQGEYVGLKAIKAYLEDKNEKRHKVLIPESAHGTNPASSVLCGFDVVTLPSNDEGILTADLVAEHMTEDVAALMITIPNTLGIFEKEIVDIAKVIHDKGGMIYCDGANLNALMCRVNFKAMGVDVMHMNLHKTFSTPHGGGGPGAGPVAAVSALEPFLPSPYVDRQGDDFVLKERPKSIGRIKPYHGSFAILLRAYCYILAYGGEGLRSVSDMAVLNANYLRQQLQETFEVAYKNPCLHEVVFSDKRQKEHGVTTMDVAKRLMDFGFHPPTVYFPLIVKGALMVEPTETVSRDELDRFVTAMRAIDQEAKDDPEKVTGAPHNLGVKRFDEVSAARNPILTWNPQS